MRRYNLSWSGARWILDNIDLTSYTKIHMEVSTGTHMDNSRNYGVSIVLRTSASNYTSSQILNTNVDNLTRKQIDATIDSKYRILGIMFFLIFYRWDPGYYVYKIWVD